MKSGYLRSAPEPHNLTTLDQSREGPLHAFPISLIQTPRLPPSHVSQRGPHTAPVAKSRSGPHRKTLNKAATQLDVSEVCFLPFLLFDQTSLMSKLREIRMAGVNEMLDQAAGSGFVVANRKGQRWQRV